jgi:hypothetical protein
MIIALSFLVKQVRAQGLSQGYVADRFRSECSVSTSQSEVSMKVAASHVIAAKAAIQIGFEFVESAGLLLGS